MKEILNKTINVLSGCVNKISILKTKTDDLLTSEDYTQLNTKINTISALISPIDSEEWIFEITGSNILFVNGRYKHTENNDPYNGSPYYINESKKAIIYGDSYGLDGVYIRILEPYQINDIQIPENTDVYEGYNWDDNTNVPWNAVFTSFYDGVNDPITITPIS